MYKYRMWVILAAALVASVAQAGVVRSSAPAGIQVVGDAHLSGSQEYVTAISVGSGNVSRNVAATVSGPDTNIHGTTKVQATQKNATSVTYGRNNAAANEAGKIGGQ